MTDLQVIWDKRCLVQSQTFPLKQFRKAFELYWKKTNSLSCRHGGQIILRNTKDGYEPSFTARRAESYWEKKDYLRAFGEYLRDNKERINWANLPTKQGFTVYMVVKESLNFSHIVWDYEAGQRKIFNSLEEAKNYPHSNDMQLVIEEVQNY